MVKMAPFIIILGSSSILAALTLFFLELLRACAARPVPLYREAFIWLSTRREPITTELEEPISSRCLLRGEVAETADGNPHHDSIIAIKAGVTAITCHLASEAQVRSRGPNSSSMAAASLAGNPFSSACDWSET